MSPPPSAKATALLQLLLLLLGLLPCAVSAAAGPSGRRLLRSGRPRPPPYTSNLLIFGDSLSDFGNEYGIYQLEADIYATGLYQGEPSNPNPSLPYSSNRFSNGRVWGQYIADADRTINVVGFAQGGATVGNYSSEVIPWLQFQVERAVCEVANGREVLGAGVPSICAIQAGSNDFFQLLDLPQSEQLAGVLAIASNLAAFADRLLSANVSVPSTYALVLECEGGAEVLARPLCDHVIVMTLPPLSATPLFDEPAYSLGAAEAVLLDLVVSSVNQAIVEQFGADGSDATSAFDLNARFDEVIDDPAAFGFKNVQDSCMESEGSGANATLVAVCDDPGAYVFWDGLHPTTALHKLIAGIFMAELRETVAAASAA